MSWSNRLYLNLKRIFKSPAMFDLSSYLKTRQQRINTALSDLLGGGEQKQQRIREAMTYALMAGGKRLRPILCMAAAEAVGGQFPSVLPAACAIEMIHTYSLIHDDLPAMDDDQLRRGKPTCHVQFDEATAILAGDALLTFAFEIFAEMDLPGSVSAEKPLGIISVVSKAAGSRGMIEGQMQDMASEGRRLDQKQLQQMHELKTGALIQAATVTGGLLSNGTEDQINRLKQYARNIGLAFQIVDDILNVEGDPDQMGKATGSDTRAQKNTYPALFGLSASKQMAKELINNALQALKEFDNKADPLRALAMYVIQRKK